MNLPLRIKFNTLVCLYMKSHTLKSFQIGMHWFPERAGGLDRVYYELFNNMNKVDVEFDGCVVGTDGVSIQSNGKVTPFASAEDSLMKRMIGSRKNVRDFIKIKKVDVIVAHFALYAISFIDILKGTPFVFHFHGPWALEVAAENDSKKPSMIKKAIEKIVYRRANRIICLSEAFANILISEYGIDKSIIRIIPGGVDVSKFNISMSRIEARSALGLEANRPTIVVVRRLARRMGLENFIMAVCLIKKKIPNILVLIAGNGGLRSHIESIIDKYDLGDNIKLLGYVPDVDLPKLYRAADYTVVPTVALEGFGLITLESLASGTPVFVTPIGGLPEAVCGLSPELVFISATPESMADKLCGAFEGSINIPSASDCLSYINQKYSWPMIASRIRCVYEEVI